jgi:hypothetical protein
MVELILQLGPLALLLELVAGVLVMADITAQKEFEQRLAVGGS